MLLQLVLKLNAKWLINGTITYKCKKCLATYTESNTSRAFRFGNDGICTNCRKTYVNKGE